MCALYVFFHYLPFMTRTRSRNITAEKEGGQEKDTYTTTKTPYRKTKDTTRKRSIKYILPANLETIRAILNKGMLNTQKDVNAAITEEELLMVCRLYNVRTARKRDGKPLSRRRQNMWTSSARVRPETIPEKEEEPNFTHRRSSQNMISTIPK